MHLSLHMYGMPWYSYSYVVTRTQNPQNVMTYKCEMVISNVLPSLSLSPFLYFSLQKRQSESECDILLHKMLH